MAVSAAGVVGHVGHLQLPQLPQGGSTRIAVDLAIADILGSGPHSVAADLPRVGKVQKCASGQSWIEEVATRATKNLFANHHTKHDANRDLPQWNVGWQRQREEQTCYQKAFVDFVAANATEDHFAQSTSGHADDVDRQEVNRTIDKIVKETARIVPQTQQGMQSIDANRRLALALHRSMCAIAKLA